MRTFAAFTHDSSTKKKLEERNNVNISSNNDNDDQNDAFTRDKRSATVSFDSVLERGCSAPNGAKITLFSLWWFKFKQFIPKKNKKLPAAQLWVGASVCGAMAERMSSVKSTSSSQRTITIRI